MFLMSMLLIQGGVHMVTRPHHQHTILNGNVTLNFLLDSLFSDLYVILKSIDPTPRLFVKYVLMNLAI